MKPGKDPLTMTPIQAVAAMFKTLSIADNAGINPVEVISTFLANLVLDQHAPHRALKSIIELTRAKMVDMKKAG